MRTTWEAALLVLVLGPGCAGGPRQKAPVDKDKGTLPNGPALNGTDLGGKVLQVVHLARGVTLAGGQLLEDVRLEGARLRSGARADADYIGAELIGATVGGDSVRLRVDEITAEPPAGQDAVHLYKLSYQLRPGAAWEPLCQGAGPAIPVAGRWDHSHGMRGDGRKLGADPREVTFACEGSAIAKCVRLGYAPWRVISGVDIAPLHAACVRAVRADYCGNGEALTRPGETINLYDAAGLQADTESWPFEAEWTPDGARCVSETRLVLLPGPGGAEPTRVRDYLERQCPSRFREGDRACIADPAKGAAILFTEHPPR